MVAVENKKIFLFIIIQVFVFVAYSSAVAQTGQNVKSSSENVANNTIIDPHFTGKDCDVCHIEAPVPGQDDLMLKFDGDDVAMCNSCHESENMTCDIHPTGIVPQNDSSIAVPESLPLFDEKITCRTCHDIYMQCKADSSKQFENILFLRNGPYEKTTEFCFLCHNREQYAKINPHRQIDENGRLLLEKCLYCHKIIPDPETVSGIGKSPFSFLS